MNKKLKEMFDKVGNILFDINQQAIEEDEEAKNLSHSLIEIIDSCEYGD